VKCVAGGAPPADELLRIITAAREADALCRAIRVALADDDWTFSWSIVG
jgi:hypothetical protein